MRGAPVLLLLQGFIDRHLAALGSRDDLLDWCVSREFDLDLIITRIEDHIQWSVLLDHVPIDRDLSTFWRGVNTDRGLIGLGLSTEESGHLSAGDFDVVGVAEST